ncbi:MAG: hypothetical protein AB3N07_01410 [Ruegeria sp.]
MSDNVVKSDTGDVLSSVKRLVSEEVREDSEFIFIPNSPGRKPGRLVLTESLRVTEQKDPKPLKLVPEFSAVPVASKPAEKTPANKPAPMRLSANDIVTPTEAPANRSSSEADKPVLQESAVPEGKEKRDLAGSLSAKIEALEAAIARTEDQWEPDGESDDAYSGTPTKAVDWPEDTAEPEPETVETPVMFTRSNDLVDPPVAAAPTLDEEALSELVAQIVRKELQGALGEGITRNIRKMVRREINKALAEQGAK